LPPPTAAVVVVFVVVVVVVAGGAFACNTFGGGARASRMPAKLIVFLRLLEAAKL